MLQFARFSVGSGADVDGGMQTLATHWRERFVDGVDVSGLRAEANVMRYVPSRRVVVRHDGTHATSLLVLRSAAAVTGVELVESDSREESEAALLTRSVGADRVRVLAEVSGATRRSLHRLGVAIDTSPPVPDGEVELRRWVREQAISRTRHRHGRLVVESTNMC